MSLGGGSLTRSRQGRALLAGQALDTLGYGVSTVALPWLVLESGGSAAAAGLVWAAESLPYLLVGLVAGALADRLPSGGQMAVAHAAQALCATAIPVLALTGHVAIGSLLAAVLLVDTCRVFADAGAIGAVAGVTGPERFVDGQATLMGAWSIGVLLGPALAGVAIALVGPAAALLLPAGIYVLAAVVSLRVGRVTAPARTQRIGASVRDGLATMRREPAILRLTALGSARSGLTAGVMALLVPLLREEQRMSATAVGFALALAALAALAALPRVGRLSRRIGEEALIAMTLVVLGAAILTLAGVIAPLVAVAAVTAVYVAQYVAGSALTGARQRRAPIAAQARVGMTAKTAEKAASAVGALGTSALVGVVGLRPTYGLLGGAVLVLGGAVPSAMRRTRAARRRAGDVSP